MIKGKGLYIHIPFCIKKCKYCDFVSFCDRSEYFDKYIDALLCEAKEYQGEYIDTVFIGGGTPTLFDEEQLKRLITGIKTIFNIEDNAEFSIEANPKTLTENKLMVLKKSGVTRLSIGVQSFLDDELLKIGRVHNSNEAIETIKLAKNSGFSNINLDLMMGLPSQTKESLLETLKIAVCLEPSHISLYSLILEEGTPLYNEYKCGKYQQLDEETDRELYHVCVEYLREKGYNRYEISNFSKKGMECRHNIKYWECEEYIGLGISAHSYLNQTRFYNTDNFNDYMQKKYHNEDRIILTKEDKISEYIMMKLRMCEGISKREFYEKFGVDIEEHLAQRLEKFINLKVMEKKNGRICFTDYGMDVSNSILCELI